MFEREVKYGLKEVGKLISMIGLVLQLDHTIECGPNGPILQINSVPGPVALIDLIERESGEHRRLLYDGPAEIPPFPLRDGRHYRLGLIQVIDLFRYPDETNAFTMGVEVSHEEFDAPYCMPPSYTPRNAV